MKFNFKIQQYQTDAVDAVVQVFNGQRKYERTSYIRDIGSTKNLQTQMSFLAAEKDIDIEDILADTGYKNEAVELDKNYDEPETVAFVNGVLGGFMRGEMTDAASQES